LSPPLQERYLLHFVDPLEVTMNQSFPGRLLILGIAAAFALSSPYVAGQSVLEGRTSQDRRFVAGGIGLDESEHMKSVSRDFPLSVLVATKSGEYLADTHIRIEDVKGQTVLETQLAAPYLLVDLAQGKYKVEAIHQGERRQQNVNIDANTRAKVVFTFAVPG
jgi:hypothetical protein